MSSAQKPMSLAAFKKKFIPTSTTDEKPYTAPQTPLTPRKSAEDFSTLASLPTNDTKENSFTFPQPTLPPTPDTTPQLPSRTLKRPLPTDADDNPFSPSAKRPSSTTISPSTRRYLFPPQADSAPKPKRSIFRKTSSSAPKTPTVAAIEMKRAAEAVLRQVDWQEVAEYVACNRRGLIYKAVVKKVLQDRVDRLFEEEEAREEEQGQEMGGEKR